MANLSASKSFMDHGGEMGALIRAFDWVNNPLGPPELWPQSLKTSISIMLRSGYPIFVWWGKDMIMFNNDAYLPVLGNKHPASLGSKANDTWVNIWEQISPMMDQVLYKGEQIYAKELLFLLDRKGFSEECYFTFSYSPIENDEGGVGGIFCASNEETEKVFRQRRLKTLKDISDLSSKNLTLKEIYQNTITVLKENPNDIPFSLLYIINEDGSEATLEGFSGIDIPPSACPASLSLKEKHALWPYEKALKANKAELVEGLKNFGDFPGGPWNESAEKAVILPIHKSGQGQFAGFLVVGVSPKLALDEEYKTYFELTAGQISTVISNVTAFEEERKRAEALAEIDKAKTVFFSNISHEFRTPLSLMISPLEDIINRHDWQEEEIRGQLDVVYRNSRRLLKLVNTLLDFSRIEAGRVQAVFKKTDVSQLTSDLSSLFSSAMEKGGIKYTVNCEDISAPVYVDATMYERIVFNLLSNAYKFTFQGAISVSLKQVNGEIQLLVKDSGTGIAQEELPRLFSRFHRIENAKGRTHEGSGIGLAMVAELAKLHGGHVNVESKLGEGSSFMVSFPIGNSHLPKEQIADEDSPSRITLNALPDLEEELNLTGQVSSLQKELHEIGISTEKNDVVLIVDDNKDMREYVAKLLNSKFKTLTASDGLEALELMKTTTPSLVLSDIMMPNLDGLGLLKEIRTNNLTSSMPVILISARAGEEDTIKGIEAGADDYLVKPFSSKELVSRVESTIKISKTRLTAERHLRNLFDQAHVAITILNGPEHVIELANDKAIELWGKKYEDVINKATLAAFPELVSQGFGQILGNVYRKGERFTANQMPLTMVRNGIAEACYVNFIYDPLRDLGGNITGIVGIGVDVTELVEARIKAEKIASELNTAHQSLVEKNSQLTRINNDLDDFVYTASHDLRAPISNIEGLMESLNDTVGEEIKKSEDFSLIMEMIQNSIVRFKTTISDLTEISKIQRNIEDETEEVSIYEVIQDVKYLIKDSIEETGTKIELDIEKGCIIRFSRKNIQSIIYNLLSNAIKYRSAKRIPAIVITAKKDQNDFTFSLQDNGLGIHEEQIPNMFKMFKRLHQHVEGSGIGLYLVKRIIDNSGGKIKVKSEIDKGTTFTIHLPLLPVTTSETVLTDK